MHTLPVETDQDSANTYCDCLADTVFDYMSTRSYIREDIGYVSRRSNANIADAHKRARRVADTRCAGALRFSIPLRPPAVRE